MTTFNTVRYAAITLLFLLTGCSHRVPQATVEVIDTSLSITPRAEKAALDAVRESDRSHAARGSAGPHPHHRGRRQRRRGARAAPLRAYPARDLRYRSAPVSGAGRGSNSPPGSASLDPHQSRTDILGALDAARQEFAVLPKGVNRKLIVVSDFLEDDGTYRFVSAGSLAQSGARP